MNDMALLSSDAQRDWNRWGGRSCRPTFMVIFYRVRATALARYVWYFVISCDINLLFQNFPSIELVGWSVSGFNHVMTMNRDESHISIYCVRAQHANTSHILPGQYHSKRTANKQTNIQASKQANCESSRPWRYWANKVTSYPKVGHTSPTSSKSFLSSADTKVSRLSMQLEPCSLSQSTLKYLAW
jgi:hypothetical protein